MLTGLINAISVLTKKLIPTLTASILLTILPHGCVLMGADILEMLDFTSILNSHSLLQYSLGIDADFLYGAGVYWILIGGWFLLTALLVWRAYCAFTKKNHRKDL